MGANGSYSKLIGGVPENNRTHIDTKLRVQGHKVLLQKQNIKQSKNVMYSNSDSPIYLIAKRNADGTLTILSVNVFDGHRLSKEIDIKMDSNGHLIPYNGRENGTHCHSWVENKEGEMSRQTTNGNPHKKVQPEFNKLLDDIVKFNNKHIKYNAKK